MAGVVLTISDKLKEELDSFPWINWSMVGREEFLKKDIFEEFIKTGRISAEDEKFCEELGWDPLDELEVREEYIEKLKKIEAEPRSKPMNLKELDRLMGL